MYTVEEEHAVVDIAASVKVFLEGYGGLLDAIEALQNINSTYSEPFLRAAEMIGQGVDKIKASMYVYHDMLTEAEQNVTDVLRQIPEPEEE